MNITRLCSRRLSGVASIAAAAIVLTSCRNMGATSHHHALADAEVPTIPTFAGAQGCGGGGGQGGHHGSGSSCGGAATASPPALASASVEAPAVYPLGTCPVSGAPLGGMGAPVARTILGREIRFCCAGCLPKLEDDPATYLAKIDRQIATDQRSLYPLDTSLVSGKAFDTERGAYEFVYRNRLVLLTDEGEKPAFLSAAPSYLARLDAIAAAQQKARYPVDHCVIDGTRLGAQAFEFVSAGRLVRVCNAGERAEFSREPATNLARLDDAWKAAGGYPSAITDTVPGGPTQANPERERGHDHGRD